MMATKSSQNAPKKKLDEIVDARLCDIFESIENSLKKKIVKSKIDRLNEELRMLVSGDAENEARILREIDGLRRG